MRKIAAALSLGLLLAACGQDQPLPTEAAPQFGKSGKQTTSSKPPTNFMLASADAGLAIQGDGIASYAWTGPDGASYSAYRDGECGVRSVIHADVSGDATMQTDNPRFSTRKCADYPRLVTLAFPDGYSETIEFFVNVHQLHTSTSYIPVGQTVTRAMAVNPTKTTRCDALRLDSTQGGDDLRVTRIDARTWLVESTPDSLDEYGNVLEHNDEALCTSDGATYHMPVRFYITSNSDLEG